VGANGPGMSGRRRFTAFVKRAAFVFNQCQWRLGTLILSSFAATGSLGPALGSLFSLTLVTSHKTVMA
jgi:hypothetical protein